MWGLETPPVSSGRLAGSMGRDIVRLSWVLGPPPVCIDISAGFDTTGSRVAGRVAMGSVSVAQILLVNTP